MDGVNRRKWPLGWHSPRLSDLPEGLKFKGPDGWHDGDLAIREGDVGTAVDILCGNMFIGINGILRLDHDRVRSASRGGVDRNDGLEFGSWSGAAGGVGGESVGGHD
jgi:hypothetical protein